MAGTWPRSHRSCDAVQEGGPLNPKQELFGVSSPSPYPWDPDRQAALGQAESQLRVYCQCQEGWGSRRLVGVSGGLTGHCGATSGAAQGCRYHSLPPGWCLSWGAYPWMMVGVSWGFLGVNLHQ